MSKDKTVRKACYLCTTPFQVIGAIALEKEKNENADIFLFDDNRDYKTLGSRLKAANIFQNIFCVNFYTSMINKGGKAVRLRAFLRMMFCEQYVNDFIDKKVSYERLYTSSSAVSKMVIASGLYKKNPAMKIYMYDDGIGSYSKKEKTKTGSKLFQKAKRILKWKEILSTPEAVYLYQPELAAGQSDIAIQRMPAIKVDSEVNQLLGIFSDNDLDDLLIKEKVIIFDTLRSGNGDRETLKILDKVYDKLCQSFGMEQLIIKEHPRSIGKIETPIKHYAFSSLPIEIVYMRQNNLRNKILVALNSTAVFTPKMLFGEEPYVILLYRLVSRDPEIRKRRDELYLRLLSMYEDQSRVCIPETFEELRSTLDIWISES